MIIKNIKNKFLNGELNVLIQKILKMQKFNNGNNNYSAFKMKN